MVLPLTSINLVIPNSGVAEIIGYSRPRSLPDSSDWFPGVVLWRGVYVPVVIVEKLCSLALNPIGPRARIAVLYNPQKNAEVPYVGIQMLDIPRAYLAELGKMETGSDDDLSPYFLSRLDDDLSARVIPNLDVIISELEPEFTPEKLKYLSD